MTTDVLTRKTVSISKACELAAVCRRTVYNWLDNGRVEYVRTAGGCIRIFVDTLFNTEPRTVRPSPQKARTP